MSHTLSVEAVTPNLEFSELQGVSLAFALAITWVHRTAAKEAKKKPSQIWGGREERRGGLSYLVAKIYEQASQNPEPGNSHPGGMQGGEQTLELM